MKKGILLLSAAAVLLVAGCAEHTTVYVPVASAAPANGPAVAPPNPAGPTEGTVVEAAPPAPQVEVYGVAPGPGYIWAGGYWNWYGGRWVWAPGRWIYPPYRGARWLPGYWSRRGGRSYWVRGRWR